MDFLPAWQGVNFRAEFQKNMNIIPAFANRSGNFYSGDDNTYLEFTNLGQVLRHWTAGAPPAVIKETEKNQGYAQVPLVGAAGTENRLIRFPITAAKYNGFQLSFSAYADIDYAWGYKDQNIWFKMMVKWTPTGGNSYWLQNSTRDQELQWSTSAATVELKVPADVNLEFGVPTAVNGRTADMEIRVYFAHHGGVTTPVSQVNFKNFRLNLVEPNYQSIDYKDESLFNFSEVNLFGSEPPQDWDFKWGITPIESAASVHDYILSAPYNSVGTPMTSAWMHEPDTDALGITQPLKTWLYNRLYLDNETVTRKIKGSFVINSLTSDIVPHRIVQDKEGRYYQFVSGEYDDKNKTWTGVEFIEFKAYKT